MKLNRSATIWLILAFLCPLAGRGAGYFVEAGDILAANFNGDSVLKISVQFGAQENLGAFTRPMDLALSPSGDLYVCELSGSIKRLTLTNGVTTRINPATTLTAARGIVFGPSGDLFVTGSGDRVLRVNPVTGAETNVTEGGQLTTPVGIDFVDSTHLAVVSLLNSPIVIVDITTGGQTVLPGAETVDFAWGVAARGSNIFFTRFDQRLLYRLTDGVLSIVRATAGFPYGLGLEPDGTLVAGSNGPDVIQRISPQGVLLSTFSGGQIRQVTGIEVAPSRIGTPPPNVAPVLNPIGTRTVDEGTPLAFQVTATDANLPFDALTFSLAPGAPPGVALSPSGDFYWSTTETDGPGTNQITVIVTDHGIPSLSNTQMFTVVVNEVNAPPVLGPVTNHQAVAGTLLSFTFAATDFDLPVQSLTFSLEAGGAAGASVTGGGLFTWTPAPSQAPSTNLFTIRVTDSGSPPQWATASFTVVVHDMNTPPLIGASGTQVVDEGSLFTLQISATDTNQPAQTLTFGLLAGAPYGANLSPSGLFSWTPTEVQGPGTNFIALRVTDNGIPPLSTTSILAVVVREVNHPPAIVPIDDQLVRAGATLTLQLTPLDSDWPAQAVAFALLSGPGGATLSAAGLFAWTPPWTSPAGAHEFAVRIADNGSPPLAATQTFLVVVSAPLMIEVGDIVAANFTANTVLAINPLTGVPRELGVFNRPTDVTLASDGFLYVSEWEGFVKRLDLTDGTITIINPGKSVSEVWGLAMGPDRALYVISTANDSVVRIDTATGAEAALVPAVNLVDDPYGIDLLDAGHLVVGSAANSRIVSVALADGSQSLIAETNRLDYPWGVAASGSALYVASCWPQEIQRVSGGVVQPLYLVADGIPEAVAITRDGEILASATGPKTNVLLRISPQGTLLQTYSGDWLGEVTGLEVSSIYVGPALGPLILEASPSTAGPYVNMPAAVFDPQAQTVTIARSSEPSCYYRLRSPQPLRIVGIRLTESQVRLDYRLALTQISLQVSPSPTGPFLDQPAAVLDTQAQTITIARSLEPSCFYRLRGPQPTRIVGVRVTANEVRLDYRLGL